MKPNRRQIFTLFVYALFTGSHALADDSVPVTVTNVIVEDVSPDVPAAGTVFSRNEAQITAGLAGRLAWVAEPGDHVKAGDPVARFDCEMLELRREEQSALAQREHISMSALARETERLEQLQVQLVAATTQVDRMRADRDLAQAELRIAKVRTQQIDTELKRCVATAPFSGVVTQRLRRAGEDVDRNAVLAAMTDTQNLEVRAQVPIRHLPRVSSGADARITLGELTLEGRVRKVVPAADALSQTFELRVDLPDDASHILAAGQMVSVRFSLTGSAAVTVPRDSLVLREDGSYVMRINDKDLVERVAVTVDEGNGERIAVRGPISAGDRVAVRGANALSHGQTVRVQTDI